MKKDGELIQSLVEENKKLLKVGSESSLHWERYLLSLDYKISRGLVDAVHCRYVHNNPFNSFLINKSCLKKIICRPHIFSCIIKFD